MYKNKIRYLNYITEIVLKMDENNNGSIVSFSLNLASKLIYANLQNYAGKGFDDAASNA
jgi:hypothetical protein